MITSKILQSFKQPEVTFDPSNAEHVTAFKSLVIGDGQPVMLRQATNLRFKLEKPFKDVRTMMLFRVGEAFVKGVK